MNCFHHESLARHLAVLSRLSPGTTDMFPHPGDVSEFCAAASRPDRVRDIKIDFPGCDPSYVALNNNLSSLLHFCRTDGRGYCWADDLSLPFGAPELIRAFRATISFEPFPAGERSPGHGPHPMVAAVAGGATLGTFVFPSAVTMLTYYVAEACTAWKAGDLSTWRACAGFALHYLADLHCPHHRWCALRYGHQPWEDAAQAEWMRHAQMLALADDPGLLAEEVGHRYHARADLADIIAHLPRWGAPCEIAAPKTLQAIDISLDVLAAGLALLPLMVA